MSMTAPDPLDDLREMMVQARRDARAIGYGPTLARIDAAGHREVQAWRRWRTIQKIGGGTSDAGTLMRAIERGES